MYPGGRGGTIRPSGLLVPATRTYDEATRLISAQPAIEGINPTIQYVILLDDLTGVGQSVKSVTQPTPTPVPQNDPGTPSSIIITPGGAPVDDNLVAIWTMSAFAAGADTSYTLVFGRPMYIRDFLWVFNSGTGAQAGAGYPGIFLWFVLPGTIPQNLSPSWAAKPGAIPDNASAQMIIARNIAIGASVYSIHLTDGQYDAIDVPVAGALAADYSWPGELTGAMPASAGAIPWIHRHIPHIPFAGITIRKYLGANADDSGRWQLITSTR